MAVGNANRSLTTFQAWARTVTFAGSCAGILLFLLVVAAKADVTSDIRISGDNPYAPLLFCLLAAICLIMFSLDLAFAVAVESNRRRLSSTDRSIDWAGVVRLFYISSSTILVLLWLGLAVLQDGVAVFVLLLLPLLWPLAVLTAILPVGCDSI